MPRHPGRIARSFSKSSRSNAPRRQAGADDPTHESPPFDTAHVVIGTIAKPRGLHGALVVHASRSACEALRPGLAVVILPRQPGQDALHSEIWRAAPHRAGAVVELAGIDDRDAASLVVGSALATRRTELPEAPTGEYYACDVIGLPAYSSGGELLGQIEEIVATGANDVWIVRDGSRELLVPAVAHAVLEVDLKNRRVVLEPAGCASTDDEGGKP